MTQLLDFDLADAFLSDEGLAPGTEEEWGGVLYLICYDIATTEREGQRRLTQIAKFLEKFGTRVQKSVFEVRYPPMRFADIRRGLLEIIDEDEDSIRIYPLHALSAEAVEHHGGREPADFFGETIV